MEFFKRFQFSVNTSSTCFLCFEEIPHEEENEENKRFSLHNILRYLKISLCEINSLSKKPHQLLKKTDFKVSLCQGCLLNLERFSVEYQAMELSRMRVESSLEVILEKLKSSEKPGLLEAYQDRIKDGKALKHSAIVKELREHFLRKCTLKRQSFQPRIKLQRTPVPNVINYEDSLDESASYPIPIFIKAEFNEDISENLEVHEDTIEEADDFEKISFKPEIKQENMLERNSESKLFQCTASPKKLHSRRVHLKHACLKCKFCQKLYLTKEKLKIHERRHTDLYKSTGKEKLKKKSLKCLWKNKNNILENPRIKEPVNPERSVRFKCIVCEEILTDKISLAVHTLQHSQNGGRFKCRSCPKRFPDKAKLSLHVKSDHNGYEGGKEEDKVPSFLMSQVWERI